MTTNATLERPVGPAAPPARPKAAFRPDIQGLRAVAVALVVLYHAGLAPLTGGYVGVDVFFVISGFLITGLLLREVQGSGKVSIVKFYARRVKRILPASIVVILVTGIATKHLLGAVRAQSVASDGRWALTFLENFHQAKVGANYLNADVPASPLQHYWSLAVEEQFYVLWPVLMLLLVVVARKRWSHAVVVALVFITVGSFIWSVVETSTNANLAYFSPFTRAWELGIGALLASVAYLLNNKAKPAVAAAVTFTGLAMIMVSAFIFTKTTVFPGYAVALPVLGSAFVLLGGTLSASGPHMHVLGNSPLRKLGDISFALYLWHFPILRIANEREGKPLSTVQDIEMVALALGLSILTYKFLENPFRQWKLLSRAPRIAVAGGLVAIMVAWALVNDFVAPYQSVKTTSSIEALGANTVQAQAILQHDPTGAELTAAVDKASKSHTIVGPLQVPLAETVADRSPAYDDGCLLSHAENVSPDCTFGLLKSPTTVVLFGDSHAAQWMPAMEILASAQHFKLVVLTKANCPAATMQLLDTTAKTEFSTCDSWRKTSIERIRKLHPDLVVMASTISGVTLAPGSGQTDKNVAYRSGLSTTLALLRQTGTRLTVLSDVPLHAQIAPVCLSVHSSSPLDCADSRSKAVDATFQEQEKATAQAAGASFVDTVPWLCGPDVCPVVIANRVVNFDNSHLTATYSIYLARVLRDALKLNGIPSASPSAKTQSSPAAH